MRGLFQRLVVRPVGVNLLMEPDLRELRQRPRQPLVALPRGMGGTVACKGDHAQGRIGGQGVDGPFDERSGGKVAALLGYGRQTAKPVRVVLAGHADPLVDASHRIEGKKNRNPGTPCRFQLAQQRGLLGCDDQIVRTLMRRALRQCFDKVDLRKVVALGSEYFQLYVQAGCCMLHHLGSQHPVGLGTLARVDEHHAQAEGGTRP